MANEQNLRPQAHVLTVEDQSRGGVASGEARRRRRRMREALEELLSKTYTDRKTGKELDGVSMLMVSAISKAQKGDVRALEFIRSTLGEDPVRQIEVATSDDQAKFRELLERFDEDRA